MRNVFVVLVLLFTLPAFADNQHPSAEQLQKIVDSLIVQRNTALNAQAVAEANLALANEALVKAEAKIKELEKPKK